MPLTERLAHQPGLLPERLCFREGLWVISAASGVTHPWLALRPDCAVLSSRIVHKAPFIALVRHQSICRLLIFRKAYCLLHLEEQNPS